MQRREVNIGGPKIFLDGGGTRNPSGKIKGTTLNAISFLSRQGD